MWRRAGEWILYWAIKGMLSIRYRIRVVGLENITAQTMTKKGGILFLPNHPAELDPIIITTLLWPRFRPRPLVVEHFFYLKWGKYLMKLIRALPLPDFNGTVNKWKQRQIEKAFHTVAERLIEKDNFLIYPSGKLKVSAAEILGGASFVANLVKECPEANIVLLRTTGLWGSRFSRALTGTTPDFAGMIWEGIKVVLKNGIFLTPRREVLVEVQPAPNDFPRQGSRLEINQYLEKWYNVRGPEPLKLVSDLFWKHSVPKVVAPEKEILQESVSVPPEVEQDVKEMVAKLAHKNASEIERNMHLARDIGLDSLDVAQIYVFLDEHYHVEGLVPGQLQTVEDVLRSAVGKMQKLERHAAAQETKVLWPSETSRPTAVLPAGESLQEVFLRTCDKMDGNIACADALSGVLTYRRLKLAALTLAQKIAKLEGDRVGVLLPSSVAGYVVIFAILLARKTPVMFNWTVGVRALDHCLELSGVKTVLSSRRFLNELNNGDLGKLDDHLLLLEDVKDEISWTQKIRGFLGLLQDSEALLKKLRLKGIDPSSPGVILFTSGTETLPKGVPLSHSNLLSNQRSALASVDLQPRDILYGVLPPFHSFGFSVTGILPLLAGLRVYYAPDPTDSHGMARDISYSKATLLCSAPTFIRSLFHVAKPQQLSSLRYVVCGAEKTPEELFEYVNNMKTGCQLLEGYGITECGPIVTLCRPNKPRVGVGPPIPGVELRILESENGEGEIAILSPGVFGGYIGSQKNPFITIEGKTWYKSGDRGRLENGALILSGRLKRFVKIGGEMISLGGLEEEILHLADKHAWVKTPPKEGPSLAVTVRENSDKPEIILFTTFDISKEDVNLALRDCGYGRIVKIAETRKIDQIPLTGTGKTHYRALDESI
ncbi:MAG: AMP-binding protein [Verrucomicrobia bacterium]|nr:AMP-binding protein [Verrucomicrobiota bacterium]